MQYKVKSPKNVQWRINSCLLQIDTPDTLVGTRGQREAFFGCALETIDGVGDPYMAQFDHSHHRLRLFPCGGLKAVLEQLHKVRDGTVLPAQSISCLSEAPNVATCYTGRVPILPDFMEHVTLNVQDMDATCVISWEASFPSPWHCMPVSVMIRGYDDEGDDEWEGESESGQPVDSSPQPQVARRPPRSVISLRLRTPVMMMSPRGRRRQSRKKKDATLKPCRTG